MFHIPPPAKCRQLAFSICMDLLVGTSFLNSGKRLERDYTVAGSQNLKLTFPGFTTWLLHLRLWHSHLPRPWILTVDVDIKRKQFQSTCYLERKNSILEYCDLARFFSSFNRTVRYLYSMLPHFAASGGVLRNNTSSYYKGPQLSLSAQLHLRAETPSIQGSSLYKCMPFCFSESLSRFETI